MERQNLIAIDEIVSTLRKGVPVHAHGVELRLTPLEARRLERLMEDAADLIMDLVAQILVIEGKIDGVLENVRAVHMAVMEAAQRMEGNGNE